MPAIWLTATREESWPHLSLAQNSQTSLGSSIVKCSTSCDHLFHYFALLLVGMLLGGGHRYSVGGHCY